MKNGSFKGYRTAFALGAVVLMIALSSSVLLDPADDVVATVTGSGTAEDPFTSDESLYLEAVDGASFYIMKGSVIPEIVFHSIDYPEYTGTGTPERFSYDALFANNTEFYLHFTIDDNEGTATLDGGGSGSSYESIFSEEATIEIGISGRGLELHMMIHVVAGTRSGSGTESNPYSGYVSSLEDGMYVAVGSRLFIEDMYKGLFNHDFTTFSIRIEGPDGSLVVGPVEYGEEIGMDYDSYWRLSGTATAVGTYHLISTITHTEGETEYESVFYVVEPLEIVLAFTSDPVRDGVVIFPNPV